MTKLPLAHRQANNESYKIDSLVFGIVILALVLIAFILAVGINALGEADVGKTNYEYEQDSRTASSTLYSELDRSLFTTASSAKVLRQVSIWCPPKKPGKNSRS